MSGLNQVNLLLVFVLPRIASAAWWVGELKVTSIDGH
jgi:hypothetical protein